MRNLLCLSVIVALTACTSSTKNNTSGDSLVTGVDTTADSSVPANPEGTSAGKQDMSAWDACYVHLEGTSNQDTTSMKLRFRGNAEGEYNWIPSQKDARRGTVKLTVSGNMLKGTWTFMQEGMTDSLPVEFKMDGDKLYQKRYKVDPSTGRQYLDAGSPFDTVFDKVACSK